MQIEEHRDLRRWPVAGAVMTQVVVWIEVIKLCSKVMSSSVCVHDCLHITSIDNSEIFDLTKER
jgi:hypothetical protein